MREDDGFPYAFYKNRFWDSIFTNRGYLKHAIRATFAKFHSIVESSVAKAVASNDSAEILEL